MKEKQSVGLYSTRDPPSPPSFIELYFTSFRFPVIPSSSFYLL